MRKITGQKVWYLDNTTNRIIEGTIFRCIEPKFDIKTDSGVTSQKSSRETFTSREAIENHIRKCKIKQLKEEIRGFKGRIWNCKQEIRNLYR